MSENPYGPSGPPRPESAEGTGLDFRQPHDDARAFHHRLAQALGQAGYSADKIRRYLGDEES